MGDEELDEGRRDETRRDGVGKKGLKQCWYVRIEQNR